MDETPLHFTHSSPAASQAQAAAGASARSSSLRRKTQRRTLSEMPAEATHESGRTGLLYAKEWLERTGTVAVEAVAGMTDFEGVLATEIVPNHYRHFDLLGFFYGRRKRYFFAEVKHYTMDPPPKTAYDEFLALSYRNSLTNIGANAEYMFITWHPFSVGNWSSLRTSSAVRGAVESRSEWLPDGHVIEESSCQELAARLWIIVLSERSVHLQLPLRLARRVFADLQVDEDQNYRSGEVHGS